METKIPDFFTTMSRTIKCNHCSKLFVNQQGFSVHEKCVHGVRGMTKAAGKEIQPTKNPVGETESEIKIAVQDTLLWISSFQLFMIKSTGTGFEEGTIKVHLLIGRYSYMRNC